MKYFITVHDDNPIYSRIWEIQKTILEYFGFNYIEGIVVRDGSDVDEKGVRRMETDSLQNLKIYLNDYESKGNVGKFFMTTLWRHYLVTLPYFKDEDIFIINDADLICPDPRLIVNNVIPELDKTPDKVLATHAYHRSPRRRFCSTYQTFYVKTVRTLLGNLTIPEMMEEARVQGEGFYGGLENTEEHYLGQKYFDNQLCRYLDWDDPETGFHTLLDTSVIMGDNFKTLDLNDYFVIHGYQQLEFQKEYLQRVRYLINKYYKNKAIDLRV